MYCSKCGLAIKEDQEFCAACGKPTGKALAASMFEDVEQKRFERTIRNLSRFWYLFAGLNVVLGCMGLFAIQTGLTMHAGPWEPWPHPYIWDWTLIGSAAWTLLAIRTALAATVGWGLAHRIDWGRTVALLAAAIAFLQFPIGLVLGIYSFSALLGRHHARQYEQLREGRTAVGVR